MSAMGEMYVIEQFEGQGFHQDHNRKPVTRIVVALG